MTLHSCSTHLSAKNPWENWQKWYGKSGNPVRYVKHGQLLKVLLAGNSGLWSFCKFLLVRSHAIEKPIHWFELSSLMWYNCLLKGSLKQILVMFIENIEQAYLPVCPPRKYIRKRIF